MSILKASRPGSPGPGDPGVEGAQRRVLRVGFGALWAFDALLQLRPVTFRTDLVVATMHLAAAEQPAWLAGLIDRVAALTAHEALAAHLGIVVVQAAIALLLLTGRLPWVRGGAILAVLWSATAWLVGEGLGGLLTGSASLLTGAPGCVALYGLAAALLLLPERGDALAIGRRRLPAASLVAASIFLLAAFLQANRADFTAAGLTGAFAREDAVAQPLWVLALLHAATAAARSAPAGIDAALIAAFVVAGAALAVRPDSRTAAIGATALLTAAWVVGQDIGGLFTAVTTDPDSAVALVLIVWAGCAGARAATRAPASAWPGRAASAGLSPGP